MRSFASFLLALALVTPLRAALSWDALPAAVSAAPKVSAIQAEAWAAQARRRGLSRSFAPRLEAFAQGRSEGAEPGLNQSWPEAGIRGRLNLWRKGQDGARAEQADAQADQATALAEVSKRDLLILARQAWLEAWQARQRLKALQAAQVRCEEDLKRIRRQAQSGLVPRSDVLALETLAAELDQHVFDETHLADEAEHHLAALLGLPAAQAEGLADGSTLTWPDSRLGQRAERAEQAALRAQTQARLAESKALGGMWQPSLDLDSQFRAGRAGYSLSDARDWQALAVLSLAWDPASAVDKEQAWLKGQAQASQWALEAQVRADAVELAELQHALSSWVGRKGAVEQRLAATAEFRQAVLDENARGVRDSRDLKDSNEALLEADADLTVAQARAWSVWSELQAFGAQP